MSNGTITDEDHMIHAEGVDEEPPAGYERRLREGPILWAFTAAAIFYAAWHLYVLNISPVETIMFRILHIAGTLSLGFILAMPVQGKEEGMFPDLPKALGWIVDLVAAGLVGYAVTMLCIAWAGGETPEPWVFQYFGQTLAAGTALAILSAWFLPTSPGLVPLRDWVLMIASMTVCGFLLFGLQYMGLRMRAGTSFVDPQNGWVAMIGVALILELTRRVAGLALVIIAGVFVAYAFAGPYLPGILEHRGYPIWRFFSYLYTGNGILGPTTAVSSTYIILFIIFAAFLQASKVGDYFVNFAFAAAGHARGGPAKVAVFASGLMGMINGTSAGNVVATGSLTIPLMKRVGYKPQSSAAIEAAASTGGQIMPPIMGAGAFIMAEITGIPYTELVIAALIPAILYFASVYFMVDFEARKLDMKGLPRSELPRFGALLKQVYLFVPIVILIYALFVGYSVIRAGTLSTVAALVISWLTPHAMGPRAVAHALALASRMGVQIITVCAAAGVIVGVIALTGIGSRFSSLLLQLAEQSQLLALFFAMCIAIILGMGMPTTAAYAVAASVVAPGLIQIGIEPLVAHFFVFYFAVISAITPPVALAAYAAAGIAGSDPMKTSVESFRVGIAAFIVPFMFYYSPGILMVGETATILQNLVTATVGVFLLAGAAIGYFKAPLPVPLRIALLCGAVLMISGGVVTDLAGLAIGGAVWLFQMRSGTPKTA